MVYQPKYFKGWSQVAFPAGKQSYTVAIAWWLAQCSQLAYENKITVATELKQAGFEQIAFFDAGGTQAFLATHPGVNTGGKFAILAFRGTEQDSIDILTDINFVKRLFPNENLVEAEPQTVKATQKSPKKTASFYAHGGFLEGIYNVWGSALSQDIQSLYPEGKVEWKGTAGISEAINDLAADLPLYLTGHSLGGALATLAAYKALVYRQVTGLYTFGSPRVVQQPLAEAINADLAGRLHRVVNHNDVVPRLPPRLPPILDFHHVEQLVYFTKLRKHKHMTITNIVLSDTGVLALAFLEIILALISFKRYIPRTILNHRIAEYVKDIERELSLTA
ncbi:lipase family protein [Almyronema epifaneia]|uniref:Lipase family protein n=1 Tax=Almyronema epifaneia S1 TaxID=2991925 RepID=A0ABW6IHH1_9CYAN